MLRRFSIDNFKSLSEFSLPSAGEAPLPQFVCLIGLNGSGKSTVLQALDFLSQLVVGKIDNWLETRKWDKTHLLSKISKKRTVNFQMEFDDSVLGNLKWTGAYNALEGRCVSEELEFETAGQIVSFRSLTLKFERGTLRDDRGGKADLTSDFSGSVFARLRPTTLKKDDRFVLSLLHHFLSGVKSLELLSPSAMRMPSREAVDVGTGGEKLAAFVDGLSASEKKKLATEIAHFYPRISRIGAKSSQFGWKRLNVAEMFESQFESDARHVNDGLLRIAAIVAQTVAEEGLSKELQRRGADDDLGNPDNKDYQFILLEEIENGINPELVARLVKYLTQVRQQVFVTTHSPLILNYLTDQQARESVFLLYRAENGSTRVVRFFDLPEADKRLEVMGAGEAYLDVGLEAVSSRLAATTLLSPSVGGG